MADTPTTPKNKGQEASDSAPSMASGVVDGIKNAAGYVAGQTKDAASYAARGVASAGSYLDHKAEDATASIGGGLQAAGDAIQRNSPQDGLVGRSSAAVAETFTSAGEYLKREGLEGIANDFSALIKKNPIPSLLIGFGIGFLIARATPRA